MSININQFMFSYNYVCIINVNKYQEYQRLCHDNDNVMARVTPCFSHCLFFVMFRIKRWCYFQIIKLFLSKRFILKRHNALVSISNVNWHISCSYSSSVEIMPHLSTGKLVCKTSITVLSLTTEDYFRNAFAELIRIWIHT